MNVYFGLGSNLGNRLQNLRNALTKLSSLGKVIKCSDVFATAPWGGVEQPDYLNACVSVDVDDSMTPPGLLACVKEYERELGRVPSVRWGERKIDIDILLIEGMTYHSDTLDIPHVSMCERLFVLVPLMQLVPREWTHPVNGKTIGEMIGALEGESYPLRIMGL